MSVRLVPVTEYGGFLTAIQRLKEQAANRENQVKFEPGKSGDPGIAPELSEAMRQRLGRNSG